MMKLKSIRKNHGEELGAEVSYHEIVKSKRNAKREKERNTKGKKKYGF